MWIRFVVTAVMLVLIVFLGGSSASYHGHNDCGGMVNMLLYNASFPANFVIETSIYIFILNLNFETGDLQRSQEVFQERV